jgi:hypothetical protein
MQRTPQDPLPLLRDRIAATPAHKVESSDSGAAAVELIGNLAEVERRLVGHLFPGKLAVSLHRMAWSSVARTVYEPAWRTSVQKHAAQLAGMDPQSLPRIIRDLPALSVRVPNPPGRLLDSRQRAAYLRTLLHSALSLVLMDDGWEATPQAGELVFARDGNKVNLTEELEALESGTMSPETWLERWRLRGLADVPLVSLSTVGDS